MHCAEHVPSSETAPSSASTMKDQEIKGDGTQYGTVHVGVWGGHVYSHSQEMKGVCTHMHTDYVHTGTHLNTVHMHTIYTQKSTMSLPTRACVQNTHTQMPSYVYRNCVTEKLSMQLCPSHLQHDSPKHQCKRV